MTGEGIIYSTMSELHIPRKEVIQLEPQPFFPYTDLTNKNSQALSELLTRSNTMRHGLQAQGEHLEPAQRYIHMLSDLALKATGVATRYDETELRAFSHGFATFELVNMTLKPTQLYDAQAARSAVSKLFADTRSSDELEFEELIIADREGRDPLAIHRDRPLVEIELAERHAKWAKQQPNMYDVMVTVGERRGETIRALQARTMGATIAYQLETGALDAA